MSTTEAGRHDDLVLPRWRALVVFRLGRNGQVFRTVGRDDARLGD